MSSLFSSGMGPLSKFLVRPELHGLSEQLLLLSSKNSAAQRKSKVLVSMYAFLEARSVFFLLALGNQLVLVSDEMHRQCPTATDYNPFEQERQKVPSPLLPVGSLPPPAVQKRLMYIKNWNVIENAGMQI